MSVIYFPAHPSYFEGRFTQEEIDAAIKGLQFIWRPPFQCELQFLRTPGETHRVVVDEGPNAEKYSSEDRSGALKLIHDGLSGYRETLLDWFVKDMEKARHDK